MPDERRNSQPLSIQLGRRRMFGSLPNILDSQNFSDDKKKRPKWARHQKLLSQEEGKILNSLNEMYMEIDPEKSDDLLTPEQKVIRQLKKLYEDDSLSYRPVAPREKVDLAISKPLLESVYSNPKLEKIVNDQELRNLDADRFSYVGARRFTDDIPMNSSRTSPRISGFQDDEELQLKRYSSKEDLTAVGVARLSDSSIKRSSLKSNNSDSSLNFSQKKRVSFDEQKNSCLVIKEFLSMESLENIYKSIDQDVPEDQLTKEQRFALRLKTSFQNLGEKPELRKRPTFKKQKVTIGLPTQESVLQNTKLYSIIKDPIVMEVGDSAEKSETVELRKLNRMKKHLGDINRVLKYSQRDDFEPKLNKRKLNLSSSLENLSQETCFKFKRISSSMENLLLDRIPSEPTEIQIEVVKEILPVESFASPVSLSPGSSSIENSLENLVDVPNNHVDIFEIKDISNEHFEPDPNSSTWNEGRVSFPLSETEERTPMRLLSINSIEMEDEDEVLARYKRYSLDHGSNSMDSDSDSQTNNTEELYPDMKSLQSINLSTSDSVSHSDEKANEEARSQNLDAHMIIPDNSIIDFEEDDTDLEEKENKKMKALYKDVVQEIKRKYSYVEQDDNDTSDEEDINIFSPKEGKIEIKKFSADDKSPTNRVKTFMDDFYSSNSTFIFGENINAGDENNDPITRISELSITLPDQTPQSPIELQFDDEVEYMKCIRRNYKEDFEEIDKLGYISDTVSDPEFVRKKLHRQSNVVESFSDPIHHDEITQTYSSLSKVKSYSDVVLTQKEVEMLSRVKKTNSRPLSEINMDDIFFIETMKAKYLKNDTDKNEPDSFNRKSSISSEKKIHSIHRKSSTISSMLESNPKAINSIELTKIFLNNEKEYSNSNFNSSNAKLIENETQHTSFDVQDSISSPDGNDKIFNPPNIDETPKFVTKVEILFDNSVYDRESNVPVTFGETSTKSPIYQCIEVNENYNSSFKENSKKLNEFIRKPQPLPRKHRDICKEKEPSKFHTSMSENNFASVSCVKIEHEKDEDLLPNSSEIMDAAKDMVEVVPKLDQVSDQPSEKGSVSVDENTNKQSRSKEESTGETIDMAASSNVMMRKTKKFVKDGDQVSEFDDSVEALDVHMERSPDYDTFDNRLQLIPDSLVDYADSESKITLFDSGLRDPVEFNESCSRPQTSTRGSTTFRLSYYGENSEESVDNRHDSSSRHSKERVSLLKQKFESLANETDELKTNSKEISESRKSQIAKLLNDKAAYDLVFKTDSKYWFDSNSEADKPDPVIHHSVPSFDSSTSGQPLNITILDPRESETNANYQHLFQNDPFNGVLQKSFIGSTELSELNLKTSIPCVDFTTLSPMVEKGSNASLYNFSLVNDDTPTRSSGTHSKKKEDK